MRRLNYTGRVRIAHHHVEARGTVVDERPVARVDLDLATLNFEPTAAVFVEFYRRTTFVRRPAGSVADHQPVVYQFDEFGDPAGVLVRVKVVATGGGGGAGRLLGVADRVRIEWDESAGGGTVGSLLPFRSENLGSLVWDLDLYDQPVVLINEDLADWNDFARSEQFVAIAYPEILRRVAVWAARSIDDEGPAGEWREFLTDLTGAPIPFDPDADEEIVAAWARECVDRFADQHRMLEWYGRLGVRRQPARGGVADMPQLLRRFSGDAMRELRREFDRFSTIGYGDLGCTAVRRNGRCRRQPSDRDRDPPPPVPLRAGRLSLARLVPAAQRDRVADSGRRGFVDVAGGRPHGSDRST